MKIAVSGKGGVGKTTVAANLVHCFVKRGSQVYAVDADPDASLGLALGLDPAKLEQVRPLIEMKELIAEKNAGGGAFVSLNPKVDDVLEDFSLKEGSLRFLRMGGVKQGGSACYCKENSFLNSVLTTLFLEGDDAVVMDMSAGIEHLTRGTSRGVDLLLVVTEPTQVSLKTAKIVMQLAADLGIEKIRVLGNKIRLPEEEAFLKKNLDSDLIVGTVPFSDKVLARALEENNTLFSEGDLLPGMEEIFTKLLGGE